MKLSQCTYGVLVVTGDEERVGMVVGITNNVPYSEYVVRKSIDKAIPLVQWSCGNTSPIHHGNLKVFKG